MNSTHIDAWVQPRGYNFAHEGEYTQFTLDHKVAKIVDPIEQIADDLYELEHPDHLDNYLGRRAFVADMLERGVEYGTWFLFDETDTLVRFAPKDDHLRLRTGRNRTLIRWEEQQRLYGARVAVLGLSVGSEAVKSMVQTGIGSDYMLFDPDRISVANLNRLNASFEHVGDLKTTEAGRKIGALDPYIHQRHFPEGYTKETDGALREMHPDIIIEEVDDMGAKAAIRHTAAELGIPLVMAGDVHDKSVLSVERYDLPSASLFNGHLSQKEVDALMVGNMSPSQKESALIKLIGMQNISLRMLDSAPRIGTEIAGMPQLGTTATVGGAVVATAARDILLGYNVKSGRRTLDLKDIVGTGKTTSVSETVRILRDFLRYRKVNK